MARYIKRKKTPAVGNRCFFDYLGLYLSLGISSRNAFRPCCQAQSRFPFRVMYGVYITIYSSSIDDPPLLPGCLLLFPKTCDTVSLLSISQRHVWGKFLCSTTEARSQITFGGLLFYCSDFSSLRLAMKSGSIVSIYFLMKSKSFIVAS